MPISHSQTELKLAVARFLELSYSTDGTTTARLMREVGPVKLSVDHHGLATLDGRAGKVTFSAQKGLRELGMELRMADVSMHVDDQGLIQFTASFRFLRAASATTRGSIDVEKLITSCSGLLCAAARALIGARKSRDNQLLEALQ